MKNRAAHSPEVAALLFCAKVSWDSWRQVRSSIDRQSNERLLPAAEEKDD